MALAPFLLYSTSSAEGNDGVGAVSASTSSAEGNDGTGYPNQGLTV